MCDECAKSYVEGYIKGLNLDSSSDFTKAINEISKYQSFLCCKITKLENKLDILKTKLCYLEGCSECTCYPDSCSCGCNAPTCSCPNSCSCKLKCSNCENIDRTPTCCCDENCDCCCEENSNGPCCC